MYKFVVGLLCWPCLGFLALTSWPRLSCNGGQGRFRAMVTVVSRQCLCVWVFLRLGAFFFSFSCFCVGYVAFIMVCVSLKGSVVRVWFLHRSVFFWMCCPYFGCYVFLLWCGSFWTINPFGRCVQLFFLRLFFLDGQCTTSFNQAGMLKNRNICRHSHFELQLSKTKKMIG